MHNYFYYIHIIYIVNAQQAKTINHFKNTKGI
jgi:hypothetical protein